MMKTFTRGIVLCLVMAVILAASPALILVDQPASIAKAQGEPQTVFLPVVKKMPVEELPPFSVQIAGLSQVTASAALANLSPAEAAAAEANLIAELDAAFPTHLEAIKQSGAGYVRVYIDWTSIQPVENGPYSWSFYDIRLPKLHEAGLGLIATVNNAPAWAKDNNDLCGIISNEQAYYQFLTALAKRYPYITVWEILNEPDALVNNRCGAGVMNYGEHGADYARLLQGAYNVIKGMSPAYTVIMGGLAYDHFADQDQEAAKFNRYFLDDVVKAGGASYMDGFNFHYFKNFASGWEGWTNGDGKPTCLGIIDQMDDDDIFYFPYGRDITAKASHMTERMNVCYGVSKPLWLTEIGANGVPDTNPDFPETQNPASHFYGADMADQARYVFTIHARGFAAGAENITWYAMKIIPEITFLDHQGLLFDSRDPALENQPKPAYYAYQTMTRELGNYRYEKWVNFDPRQYPAAEAYQFQHASSVTLGNPKIVAWSNSTDAVPLTLAQTEIRVVSRPGNGVFAEEFIVTDGSAFDADGAANGSIQFNLNIEPVIIELVK